MVSPTLGVGALTLLANSRSACCGVTPMLAVLLVVTGSNWSACVMLAVLICWLGLTMMTFKTSVCGADAATVPTLQRPVVLSYVPCLGIADTNDRPLGRGSRTWTLVASSGPVLLSET